MRRGRQDCIGHVGCTAPFARPYALHENRASAGLSEPYAILGGSLNRIRRRVLGNTKGLEVLRLDPARTQYVCKQQALLGLHLHMAHMYCRCMQG